MADAATARSVYDTICSTLDGMNLKYTRHDDDLVVTLGHRGEDMNHDLILAVNAKQETIQLVERLPIHFDSEKKFEIAAAIALINNTLLLGGFTYDLDEKVSFEVAQAFSDSLIGKGLIERMIMALVISVEEYDDKLMALNKGYLSYTDFAKD